jgi:predicted SAM-dependent methyltransferase
MRNCPVCQFPNRKELWTMEYQIPDGWPVPNFITWFECTDCGMIFGDGDISQAMLDDYYANYYGYGVDSIVGNVERLILFAEEIAKTQPKDARIVDFGGGDGWFTNRLKELGFTDTHNIHVNMKIPDGVDILLASHVIEHIYDLPEAMSIIDAAIKPGGLLVIDGPDTMGILQEWRMPMMDYNTKHVNHFTLQNYFDLGRQYGYTATKVERYQLNGAWSYRIHFVKGYDLGESCRDKVQVNIARIVRDLQNWKHRPVNIWGMGDITWHVLSMVDLDVVDYIDNDPAYRGRTYNGKPVMEKPDNDHPILILAQGQRELLIDNILRLHLKNRIVEI